MSLMSLLEVQPDLGLTELQDPGIFNISVINYLCVLKAFCWFSAAVDLFNCDLNLKWLSVKTGLFLFI